VCLALKTQSPSTLRWRLRVEVGRTCRFDATVKSGIPLSLMDSRRYRGRIARARRLTLGLNLFSASRLLLALPAVKPFIRVHLRPFAVVSWLLRPRMGLIVRFLQPFNRDMRINLRSRKALVAE
jgi:hypothetical protein